jgi:hypothetical protein
MVNKILNAIEKVLQSLDAGGKQSKRFAEEIKTLREVLGYPQLTDGVFEEVQRRSYLTEKLRRMSVEAEGLKTSLPTLPLEKWFDGTIEDATIDVFFEEYDLAKLLRFIADVGVSIDD